jgi:GNAT superfamily N-acetyltransferase
MDILQIHLDNVAPYEDFLRSTTTSTFRYFQSRTMDCLSNHAYTILGMIDGQPMAYGHIDFENKFWLGVCVKEEFQGKGYGKQIVQNLLAFAQGYLPIQTLHLSVDDTNEKAIALYKKFGFLIEHHNDSIYFMKKVIKQSPLFLPVSFGEFFDKLSILEIKADKINDERRQDVLKELGFLNVYAIQFSTEAVQHYYSLIKKINTSIWDKQDNFRLSTNQDEKNQLCMQIIEENDARFRIKSKINSLLQSNIVEQKGYVPKKAFLLTHLGLGDLICNIGAIRYLSTLYDEVKVVVKRKDYKNIQLLLCDDKSISFYILESNDSGELSMLEGAPYEVWANATEGNTCYLSGFYSETNTPNDILPFNFYIDYNINTEIFWTYFFVPTLSESNDLFAKVKDIKYVFMHAIASSGKVFSVEKIEGMLNISKDSILILNPNENMYPVGHPFYELANEMVNHPLAYYKTTIENASIIVCCDSSFFCLSMNLALNAEKCYYISRDTRRYEHIWNEFKPPESLAKKKFICL